MSDGFSYIVEMVDRISGPAKTAEQEIVAMTRKLQDQSGALDEMRREYAELESVLALDAKAQKQALDLIAKQEAAITKQTAAVRGAVGAEEAKAKRLKDKSAAAAAKAIKDQIDTAKNAIVIGKETIVSSIASIGGAFRLLASGDVRGAVEGLIGSVANLAKLLDLAVPGLGQAVAAVVTVAGGLAGALAGLAQAGVKLTLESVGAKNAMLSMFDAMAGGAATGEEVEEVIDRVKAHTGVLKDELVSYTKTLMAMGETDLGEIEASIQAMAASSALMGQEGVQAFTALKAKIQEAATAGAGLKIAEKQLAALYKTGVNVDDVARKMGVDAKTLRTQLTNGTADAAKFGTALEDALLEKGQGPLSMMTSQLPYLRKMLEESIGDMFEDIKKPAGEFLGEVKKLFAIFSQANPTGQALKAGIEVTFGTILETLTKLVPYVRVFFTQLVIYALQGYIALKPLIKAILDFGGPAKDGPNLLTRIMRGLFETIEGIGAVLAPIIKGIAAFISSAQGAQVISAIMSFLWTSIKGIATVLGVAVVIVGVFWAAMVGIGVAVWTVIGALVSLGAALGGYVSAAVTAIVDQLMATVAFLGGGWVTAATSLGSDFVSGLIGGITNGAASVANAVTDLAGKATGAFKNALGIASPSKVMMGLGVNTTEGLAMGVESGAPDVAGAMSNVAAVPVDAASNVKATGPAPAAASGGSVSGASITLAPGAIVIHAGSASPSELLELLTSQLSDKLEELLIQLGGAPREATT